MTDSRITLEFLRSLLRDEFHNVTITGFHEEPGSKRGDNYTSMLYRVHLTGIIKDAEDANEENPWTRSIIYKCLPESLLRREAYKSEVLFCNEVAFYTKVMPSLLEFQDKYKDNVPSPFNAIPKYFLAHNDIVILEDLRCDGFSMPDRRVGLSLQQCYAVLRVLAHFHALSLAMKHQNPEEFNDLLNTQDGISEGLFDCENEEWYRGYYRAAARNALAMVKEELGSEEERAKYLTRLSDFVSGDKFFNTMVEVVAPKEPLAVICHGDCWTNNFLFKYSDTNEVVEVKFVDFQLARYGSPALDLTNLIYCCTTREQRNQHLNSLLEFYTGQLYARLLDLSDSDNVFNEMITEEELLEKLLEEFHRCGKFGMGLALDMFPIMTCDSEQAPDLYQIEDHDTVYACEEVKPVSTSNEACRKKMTDLVRELVDKGAL